MRFLPIGDNQTCEGCISLIGIAAKGQNLSHSKQTIRNMGGGVCCHEGIHADMWVVACKEHLDYCNCDDTDHCSICVGRDKVSVNAVITQSQFNVNVLAKSKSAVKTKKYHEVIIKARNTITKKHRNIIKRYQKEIMPDPDTVARGLSNRATHHGTLWFCFIQYNIADASTICAWLQAYFKSEIEMTPTQPWFVVLQDRFDEINVTTVPANILYKIMGQFMQTNKLQIITPNIILRPIGVYPQRSLLILEHKAPTYVLHVNTADLTNLVSRRWIGPHMLTGAILSTAECETIYNDLPDDISSTSTNHMPTDATVNNRFRGFINSNQSPDHHGLYIDWNDMDNHGILQFKNVSDSFKLQIRLALAMETSAEGMWLFATPYATVNAGVCVCNHPVPPMHIPNGMSHLLCIAILLASPNFKTAYETIDFQNNVSLVGNLSVDATLDAFVISSSYPTRFPDPKAAVMAVLTGFNLFLKADDEVHVKPWIVKSTLVTRGVMRQLVDRYSDKLTLSYMQTLATQMSF